MFVYKNEYGYYIPIIKTIENLLSNPEVLREIQAPHTQTGERLGDICDGYYVKQELTVDPNFMTLEIIAYSDGVELVNPLRSKTKKHHVSLFYFTLGNINPKKRSVYQAINLLAVCKTSHLKRYGINSMLKPFIEDLKVLGHPDGCSVTVNGFRIKYKGFLVSFCGDTPANNLIGGFKESVGGAYRGCRECMVTKEEMYSIFIHDECPLRDEDMHFDFCKKLDKCQGQERAETSKLCGINQLSPLIDAPRFKLTKCFPQDVMHILLEGVVPHEFTLLVSYALENTFFSLPELNSIIESFKYNSHELTNKPSIIQREAIRGIKKIGQNVPKCGC